MISSLGMPAQIIFMAAQAMIGLMVVTVMIGSTAVMAMMCYWRGRGATAFMVRTAMIS